MIGQSVWRKGEGQKKTAQPGGGPGIQAVCCLQEGENKVRQDWLALLEKPPLYRKTCVPFWDDVHISKGMLQAHLDPCLRGASRRLDFVDRSAD